MSSSATVVNALAKVKELCAESPELTPREAASYALGYTAGDSGAVPARDTEFGPIAEQRPHKVLFGAVEGETRAGEGHTPITPAIGRDDPWFWLRDDDRKDEDVLSHLRKENAFSAKATAELDPLRKTLYEEHKGHLKETDDTLPYPYGEHYYYTRTVEGLSYRIHCRKAGTVDSDGELSLAADAVEEVLLDINKLGEGKKHCDVGRVTPSPSHKLLAFTADYTGNETYCVTVIDIATGETVDDKIAECAGSASWGADDSTLFYTTEDETKRPYKVHRHTIGAAQSSDTCVYTDEDGQYYVGMGKSKTNRFLYIESGSSETSECHFIDLKASPPQNTPTVIQPRTFGLRYEVTDHGDNFLIVTNKDKSTEGCLMHTPIASCGKDNWTAVVPYLATRNILDVDCFEDYVVLEGREGGLTRVWLMDMADAGAAGRLPDPATLRQVTFKDDLYEAGVSTNLIWNTKKLRLVYSSLATPYTWYNLDMSKPQADDETAGLEVLKVKDVLNFDGSLYETRRVFATAPDKRQVPISLVYRKDLFAGKKQHAVPTMLYGYGSYGINIDPAFDAKLLPYLDRGMLYAIAHIRGGGEMGRGWYEEEGKYLMKRNTFTDFVACAEHLIEEGYTKPEVLAMEGRSAGGLLMGAVLNIRPDLFNVALAGVPFVDVMNTMCDPSIPLTTGEWEEWGNPNEHKYFDYMLSYSPYDNVRAQPYPNILITAGLHDPRVAYWEPAKWSSKIRNLKTNGNEVLAKYDLDSGHFSASDRYKYLREKAWEQAYVLAKVGLAGAVKRPSTQ